MSSWTEATIFSLPASVFVRPRGVAVRPPLTITFVRRGATVGAWSAETVTAQPNLRLGRRDARAAFVSVARAPRRHREQEEHPAILGHVCAPGGRLSREGGRAGRRLRP